MYVYIYIYIYSTRSQFTEASATFTVNSAFLRHLSRKVNYRWTRYQGHQHQMAQE